MPYLPSTPLRALMRKLAAIPAAARPAPVRHIGPAGVALIKRFEGCARLRHDGLIEAYPDPGTGGAPWTIGWGATGRSSRRWRPGHGACGSYWARSIRASSRR